MKKKKLWFFIIGAVTISSLGFAAFSNQGEAAAIAKVEKGDIKKYVEDIGTVKCKEQKTVSIEGSGLIQDIVVEVGQKVEKGELLLRMEKQQLEIQLRNTEEKLREIEASFQGSEIRNYASSVEKARIGVDQARDAYELVLEDLKEAKLLADVGAISNEELKQTEAALRNAQALMNTAEIDLKQLEANTPDSVKEVYKAQLEQVLLSRKGIQHSLEKQEVIAPIAGVVLEKNVEVNTVGIPGTIAFVIGNVDNVEVEASILADDVSNIKPGDEVEITERSDKKQTIGGRVAKIAPSAVAVTSSLGVNQKKVAITIMPVNQSALLRPGYEVDVKIITERKNNTLLVPLSSVFDYKEKDHVFAIVDGKAMLRAIQKGMQDEDKVEILEGLKEGELVLAEPDINVKEGMKIKLANATE